MASCYLYKVNDETLKMLTVRMEPDDFWDFKAACKLRRSNMTSVVLQYAAQVVEEERQKHGDKKFAERRKAFEAKEEKTQAAKGTQKPKKKVGNSHLASVPPSKTIDYDYDAICEELRPHYNIDRLTVAGVLAEDETILVGKKIKEAILEVGSRHIKNPDLNQKVGNQ